MIVLDDIQVRVKANCPTLRAVAGAASMAVVHNGGLNKSPSAFVVPGSEDAARSNLATGGLRQRNNYRFSVLVGFNNSGELGKRGLDGFDGIRKEIIDSVLGWTPPDADMPIEYLGKLPLGVHEKTKTSWFQLNFITSETLQKLGA